jgi:hypothetical protein
MLLKLIRWWNQFSFYLFLTKTAYTLKKKLNLKFWKSKNALKNVKSKVSVDANVTW